MPPRRRPDLRPANQQRTALRIVRAQLIAGEISLYQALVHPALHGASVSSVIEALPGWGPIRTIRLLADVQPFPITPTRRCGELTIRQCRVLGEMVGR